MKKTILFYLGLILSASLFISCSDDEEEDFQPYIVGSKADVEFDGADLKTVKEAMEGTWWIKYDGEKEYPEGDRGYLTIKGDKGEFYGERWLIMPHLLNGVIYNGENIRQKTVANFIHSLWSLITLN